MNEKQIKIFVNQYATNIAKNNKVLMGENFKEFKEIKDKEIQQTIIDSFELTLNSFGFKVVPKKIKKKFLDEISKMKTSIL